VATWALLAAAVALSGSSPPPRVTLLADSVGGVLYWEAGSRAELGRRLDLRVEQQTCRRLVEPGCSAYGIDGPESALAAVQRLGSELGRIVVVNVGYNDPSDGYAHGLDQVMSALVSAGVEHVIWVTFVEREGVWAQSNEQIRAAPARWPQLTVADWAPVAAGQDWFVDNAHLNWLGAHAYAQFLRPFVLDACGPACAPPLTFCGLARAANGFEPVRAGEVACGSALPIVAAVERGDPGDWTCSRAVNADYVLDCRSGEAVIQVLQRSPVPAVRRSGGVRLANWLFRLHGRTLQGRQDGSGWTTLGRAPFCVPVAPRNVLVALRLRSLTPSGGCFTLR
jgi:hypothetical protein